MGWKTINYNWQWQLKSTPAQLWPYVADTQRFNQATGLPLVDFTELAVETGGSQRFGQTSKLGISVKFKDYPFEWIKEREFCNLRVFEVGPLARTYAHLKLVPSQSGTTLYYDVQIIPSNWLGRLGIPLQFGWQMNQKFGQVFQQIDDALQSGQKQVFKLGAAPLTTLAQTRLQTLSQNLIEQGYEKKELQQLVELLSTGADLDLARLRPYVLADIWQAPRRETLELFLAAAKIGLLQMRWDLMCPLCRGPKETASSLDQVQKGVHCSTCNIDFEANFSDNVELTFKPHPQIRSISQATYCIGGPMVTPHILAHQIIAPGETRRLSQVELPGHSFRLRTQKPGVEQWLHFNQTDKITLEKLSLWLETDSINSQVSNEQLLTHSTANKPHRERQTDTQIQDNISNLDSSVEIMTLEITNQAPHPQQLYLERADWYNDAVTATRVTSLQQFRDLFSHEVLRPGEEIGIQGMTILFSDLVGSTAMYNRWGDAASYALVREQFAFLQRVVRNYEGAIVKTIGDAIMAAFVDPASAVGAALSIQKEIYEFNAQHSEPLIIRLGLHYGPCIAVNLNDRLDYFGSTVNLAARLEGQSQGSDLVISEAVYRDPGVSTVLKNDAVEVEEFETSIKGFDDHFCLYRVRYN